MTELQFIEEARECGYSDDEIQDFLNFHEESGIPFDMMDLEMHNVD